MNRLTNTLAVVVVALASSQAMGQALNANVARTYYCNGRPCQVLQQGQTLTFVNEVGQRVTGSRVGSNAVVCGWTHNGRPLQGTVTSEGNGRVGIYWSNGSRWVSLPLMGKLVGTYYFNGRKCQILESGPTVVFINEVGQRSVGSWATASGVASGWQYQGRALTGAIVSEPNGRFGVRWANGAYWSSVAAPSVTGLLGIPSGAITPGHKAIGQPSAVGQNAVNGAPSQGPSLAAPDFNLAPTYGSVSLKAGFLPDPFVRALTAGGNIRTNLGGVNAYVAKAPDFKLQYTAGRYPLTIRVESTADTTLLIRLPNGTWIANDDSGGGLNPKIRLPQPQSGRYDIYVGTYGSRFAPARLIITERE